MKTIEELKTNMSVDIAFISPEHGVYLSPPVSKENRGLWNLAIDTVIRVLKS